jgi:hypothetical protein
MSQAGFDAFVGVLGVTAGVVSFVVLGYVEICTVPALIVRVASPGDPGAGFGLVFLVVGAAFVLIPVDILGAVVIGRYVYKRLKEPVP